MVRCLTNDQIEACLDMSAVMNVLERAYRADAEGRAVNIPRSDMFLPIGADEAYVLKVMPGAVEDLRAAAVRIQSDRIRWGDDRKVKVAAGGDQYAQHVLVYDTEAVEPILLMPDGYASKMRVGATNALGAKHMAPSDVGVVGLLGAGRQAGGQAWGVDEVFDLDVIRVYSPTPANCEGFADEWGERLDADIVAVDSAADAVTGADVLTCATNSMRPVFDPDSIEPGMHVSAIKNPEIPDAAFDRVDRVGVHTHTPPYGPHNYEPRGAGFVDAMNGAWAVEGCDFEAMPDLATLVADGVDREADETTLFVNNNGLGIQFAAVGRYLHDYACKEDFGTEIDTNLFLQSMR